MLPHDYHWRPLLGRVAYATKMRFLAFLKGQKRIKVDMYVKEYQTYTMRLEGRKATGYYRKDYWTDESPEVLNTAGYLECTGLYDSIFYWGVPVYLRIHGLEQFDIHVRNPETGKFIFSQDSSATLNDAMTSTATRDFIKGMAKTTLSQMGMQKLIFMILIGAGAIFGMWALGVF